MHITRLCERNLAVKWRRPHLRPTVSD